MRLARSWAVVLGSALSVGCATTPKAPVSLIGEEADRSALTGRWAGEYSSSVTGREGTIVFDLTAAADTARGEVWMIGRPSPQMYRPEIALPVGIERPAEVLTIRIVRVEGGLLTGVLDPYVDPETGADLVTIFRGRLEGDVISGTYATTNQFTGELSTGRWRVERKAMRVDDRR
jgi:hypothetical protein